MLAVGLAACGGGGGDNSNPPPNGGNPPPAGGIDGVGAAIGPITNFGSIFVNGVEFSTSSAQIRIEDRAGTELELEVGDMVQVIGPDRERWPDRYGGNCELQ